VEGGAFVTIAVFTSCESADQSLVELRGK
jgi:hypothetical protein